MAKSTNLNILEVVQADDRLEVLHSLRIAVYGA
jgi:hypothetical protein